MYFMLLDPVSEVGREGHTKPLLPPTCAPKVPKKTTTFDALESGVLLMAMAIHLSIAFQQ